MVQVPRTSSLGRVTPQQGPTVFQTDQVSDATFGGATGDALRRSGQRGVQQGAALLDQALNERIEHNKEVIRRALVELNKEDNLIWHGDGTPQNPGLRNLTGQDAVIAGPQASQQLLEKQLSLLERMDSRQRDLFQAASGEQVNNRTGTYDGYTSDQRHQMNQDTAISKMNEHIRDASLNYRDNKRMDGNFAAAAADAADASAMAGDSSATMTEKIQAARSAVAVAAIKGAISFGETAKAREDFEIFTAKSLLRGDDITAMGTAVLLAEKAERNQELSDFNLAQKMLVVQQEKTANRFFEQIFNPSRTPAQTTQLMGEIVNNTVLDAFGSNSKNSLINVLEAGPDGESPLELEVYLRANLPTNDPRHMSRDDVLNTPKLGTKAMRRILDDITQAERPLGKAKLNFIKDHASFVTRSSLAGKDPRGDINLGLMKAEIDELIKQAEGAGVDPMELFDPQSKNYIGNDNNGVHLKYKRNFQEILRDMIGDVQVSRTVEGGVSITTTVNPPIANDPNTRRPRETPAQWRKRTGR